MDPTLAPDFRPFASPACGAPSARGADGRGRAFGRRLRAAGGAAALALALGSACGAEEAPAPPLEVDAGPDCERGTRYCACIGGTRCGAGLVCLVGRCSLSLEEPEEAPSRPPRPRPPSVDLPEADAGATPPDAADASSGEPDAATPGDESGNEGSVDAGSQGD